MTLTTLLKPIKVNAESLEVALLHQALAVLGMPVAEQERAQTRAGESTQQKVRELLGVQIRIDLRGLDGQVIDESMAAALENTLKTKGLTDPKRSFTVNGTVRRADGVPVPRVCLVALDLDLRGVGLYRTAKTLGDLQRTGGSEALGVTASDAAGRYGLTCYDWQYGRAERKKADIVVFAVDKSEPSGAILGRSRVARASDYSDQGLIVDFDIELFEEPKQTEYERVMGPLRVFMQESGVALDEIARVPEQVSFAADELDLGRDSVAAAASAALLGKGDDRLVHELLYALARQGLMLEWSVLRGNSDGELRTAIANAMTRLLVKVFDEASLLRFLAALRERAEKGVLEPGQNGAGANSLNTMLTNALPEEAQRVSFVKALTSFTGSDYRDFWNQHLPSRPEFKNKPELVNGLLFTTQLTALTGNHQALVTELQVRRKLGSLEQLLDLDAPAWLEIVKKTGIPDEPGASGTSAQRAQRYVDRLRSTLDASFPTQRIARMIQAKTLPLSSDVAGSINTFLSRTPRFDIASSRVIDFEEELRASAGEKVAEVRSDLLRLQRVFQVSTSPDAMVALVKNGLNSAYGIANVPQRTFIQRYATALGGNEAAFAVHQRASHIAARSEVAAVHLWEYARGRVPHTLLGKGDRRAVQTLLENQLPNYTTLFGSPDTCECEACSSVYGAPAYFVDLLRFLWRGEPNAAGRTPLEMLARRRPDLLHLPLTCENTNTLIPYIDLANEVMEYYVAHDSVSAFTGYDTGDTTAAELRANPQNFNLEAYRKLKDAKYPFSLPYHQPLGVIRTYSDHLGVSRYEVMRAVTPAPNATAARAIAAEALRLSEEEHLCIAAARFDGTADTTAVHVYYGLANAGALETLSAVREFMRRAGVTYAELVALLETRFINPSRRVFDFLQRWLSYAPLTPNQAYARLAQVAAGSDPTADPALMAAITAYNAATGTAMTPVQFGSFVRDHFAQLQRTITLYEPQSKCDLDSTWLRTLRSIYEPDETSGVTAGDWSRIHRFVRLWRKLGWSIQETDLMLTALGEDDLTPVTIGKLEAVQKVAATTRLPLNQLAVLWGHLDAYGPKSLYRQLFLNKAVQQIDPAFVADAWGGYLQGSTEVLAEHRSAILAAFRLRDEDLEAIYAVAQVVDAGAPRRLNPATDRLTLANLSTVYRYAVLAKGLKLRVADLTRLIALFGATPFSRWNVQQERFVDVDPAATADFGTLVAATRDANFKPLVLQYILQGTLPAESTLGLNRKKALHTAREVRAAFSALEQAHPDVPPSPLPSDQVAAKLAQTFQTDIAARFMGILEGTAVFDARADANLGVVIPEALSAKFTYVRGSGRLSSLGVISDAERVALKALPGVNATFLAAVDALYAAPATFLADHFDGIFPDLPQAHAVLLDHPAQPQAATPEDKLAFVYAHFVPVLKSKLRRDAITQHFAALIGLSEAASAVLIAGDLPSLLTDLSRAGFSGSYFSDATWTTLAVSTIDESVDFDWGGGAPHAGVPADGFSARFLGYLAPPASGEYTFVVDVAGADEVFRLYLDDALILEKTAATATTSLEAVAVLNAAEMHRLRLDYGDASQDARVRLAYKTAASALVPIPSSAVYPGAAVDRVVALATRYHRAAKLIAGLSLTETELAHFVAFAADFGGIDFKAPTATQFRRLLDYTRLRDSVPQAQALFTEVFAAARATTPAPSVAALEAMLVRATGWDATSLSFLVDTHFAVGVAGFRNEIALNRIRAILELTRKTGLGARTITGFGLPATDFDVLHEAAQLIKNAAKANYEQADWLELAGKLSDAIREEQQAALVAYLLTRPAIEAWGARDADALFEYFLIDVQMDACMETSRIVQANASVQMFVNRVLLNLESNRSDGAERGVSPSALDRDRWEWMKAYRVWEANRKVLLYPENWLEPEWRHDRSEFFRELESYLAQNDITDRTVETAFRSYLSSLNEVGNLEVCGMFQQTGEDGKADLLHVFGRTHNSPYKFYYRTWNKYRKWSAWEKVPLDIRCIEHGDNSGVHLMPVVWKNRLFLFWPEFLVKHEKPTTSTNQSVEDVSDSKMSSMESQEYWEIKLAFSEYVDGKWSPKQVSKELVRQFHHWYLPDESATRFATYISDDNQLEIFFLAESTDPREWYQEGRFALADAASKVEADSGGWGWAHETWDQRYKTFFQNVAGWGKLELLGTTYLREETDHRLLVSADTENYTPKFDEPFFFSDPYRTYFVRPVRVPVRLYLREPVRFRPFLPGLIDRGVFFERDPQPDPIVPLSVRGAGADAPVVNELVRTNGRARRTMVTTAGAIGRRVAPAVRIVRSPARESTFPVVRALARDRSVVAWPFGGAVLDRTFDRIFDWGRRYFTIHKTGLEFHTFYHPHASDYVTNLNREGVPGLLASDTDIASDSGRTFEQTYDPNFTNGYVQKPSDFATRTYYKENVCFDTYGANSLYNWELFFHAPLYIATRLSRNGRYEEAMKWFHYIFDPNTDELPLAGQSEVSRFWKVLPFKTTPATNLEDWFRSLGPNGDPDVENAVIAEWRDNPFDPHLIASNRPLAYMKHVVIKYVENLIAWGDSLFRQDTMESVNEALQIYVIANHILGPRPESIPKRGQVRAESYKSLESKWDDFSNALVALENIFPYSSDANISTTSAGPSLLGVGSSLYFGIPENDKLLGHWDTVADRLFKIRHCQNLDGVERKLALFAPPIDPGALIQAAAQGLSLGSILADLSSPPPIYRFGFLIQRAHEFCTDVKALGGELLAALERKDGEALARLRASHETQMLTLITQVKQRQVLDAKAYKEQLVKSRESSAFRLQHYADLLGASPTLPDAPSMGAELTAESPLPETVIPALATDVDQALVESDEAGIKLIAREKEEIVKTHDAMIAHQVASGMEGLGGALNFVPNFSARFEPLGVGGTISYGGSNVGAGVSGLAKVPLIVGNVLLHQATVAAKMATYIRREQDWTLQANLAAKEITQLDKQLVSADIRIQIAEKDLANHEQAIADAQAVEEHLHGKFTNEELYQWMKEQVFAVYKQSYNLAYDLAKKAEKAYRFETGSELTSFIQYGYWDNAMQGLCAGEKLQLGLRQLEKAYLEENRRELELSKNISLARLDPLALIALRETGRCFVSLPEELFDLDHRGHYFRRIKNVRLSIPCVAGPHTSIGCSLRLLNNKIRVDTTMNGGGGYEHEHDDGVPIDDVRFRTIRTPVTAIATSQAQNDAGMFELSFRDERYLPFEGAGAISEWEIELSVEQDLRQFDYSTISDVVLHLHYTAREAGGLFKEKATSYLKDHVSNVAARADQPFRQLFSMKHEFPTEWYRFLHPPAAGAEQLLRFTLTERCFPYLTQGRDVVVDRIDLFAASTQAANYHAVLSYVNDDGDTVTSGQVTLPQNASFGGIPKATILVNDAGLALDELDIAGEITLKLKRSTAADYTALVTAPEDEIEDIHLVMHYKLA